MITGKPAPTGPVRDTHLGRERGGSASGVELDGAVYPLAGQPPVASSNGWGDLSWLGSAFYDRPGGLPVVSGDG